MSHNSSTLEAAIEKARSTGTKTSIRVVTFKCTMRGPHSYASTTVSAMTVTEVTPNSNQSHIGELAHAS